MNAVPRRSYEQEDPITGEFFSESANRRGSMRKPISIGHRPSSLSARKYSSLKHLRTAECDAAENMLRGSNPATPRRDFKKTKHTTIFIPEINETDRESDEKIQPPEPLVSPRSEAFARMIRRDSFGRTVKRKSIIVREDKQQGEQSHPRSKTYGADELKRAGFGLSQGRTRSVSLHGSRKGLRHSNSDVLDDTDDSLHANIRKGSM